MREIKFRAWDKYGYMTANITLDHLKNGFLGLYGENKIIMQYTNLKDRNGNEIYESDIVKVHIFTQCLGENMGVYEGELEFIAEIKFGPSGVSVANNKYDSGNIFFYDDFHEESLEVIGNIYENPELLKEAK